jgi:hypothetical protein
MIVQEDGRTYKIENGRVVEASLHQPAAERVVVEDKFALEERVEVDGKLGRIAFKAQGLYGPVIGVLLDSGETEAHLVSNVKKSAESAPDYETPIEELIARFDAYGQLVAYTLEEIETKEQEALAINRRAKALATDKKNPLSTTVKLDTIVSATGTDAIDLRERKMLARSVHARATAPANKWSAGGPVMGGRDDASWLQRAAQEMKTDSEFDDEDGHLAHIATAMVAQLSPKQLLNADFMRTASEYQRTYHPELQNAERFSRFEELVEKAAKDRVNERSPSMKTASRQAVNLDDFDATSLML